MPNIMALFFRYNVHFLYYSIFAFNKFFLLDSTHSQYTQLQQLSRFAKNGYHIRRGFFGTIKTAHKTIGNICYIILIPIVYENLRQRRIVNSASFHIIKRIKVILERNNIHFEMLLGPIIALKLSYSYIH